MISKRVSLTLPLRLLEFLDHESTYHGASVVETIRRCITSSPQFEAWSREYPIGSPRLWTRKTAAAYSAPSTTPPLAASETTTTPQGICEHGRVKQDCWDCQEQERADLGP